MRLKKVAFGLVMICLVSLLFSCVIAVQASEEMEIDSVKAVSVESGIPVGTIIAFAGAVAPRGYLLCDGTAYSRITYEDLYSVIGTLYGSMDGATFKVPDLRGEFLRGVDNGRGVDTGRALGSLQLDEFKAHKHNMLFGSGDGGLWHYSNNRMTGNTEGGTSITDVPMYTSGGAETRPRNVAINYCIKY
jgi:microcystin-dependent protein